MRNNPTKTTVSRAVFLLLVTVISLSLKAQKVPVSFDKYHGFNGTVEYLKKVSAAYPDLTELMEIGKSNMGRPVYVLVISNMKTGENIDRYITLRNERKEGVDNVMPLKSHQGKPGQFIGGATHGNEYTGTEVCIYIIDKLLTGYSNDENIRKLVDTKAFYICPMINPDGVYNSVEKGIAQRYNSELKDDDNDGKINEDGPDDLDGDGFITSFRYMDSNGNYVIDDVDPRLMVRLQPGEKTNKQRYSVITEDRDNDGDGKRGEDPEGGIDLNRNFPEGWWNENGFAGGSGEYPTSAPETHALAEFFTNYRNILMAQLFHTSGGFTYRPTGTVPQTSLDPKDIAVYDFIMGKKYLEILGQDVPPAWLDPANISKYKKEIAESDADKYSKMRGYEFPRWWKVSYNEKEDKRYGYGMAADWLYLQEGIYSLTTELWDPEYDIPGFPGHEGENSAIQQQRDLLKYQDEKYGGALFADWKPYNHPDLGEGETGGWKSQFARNNAFPGEPLENVCEKHWQFELFRAGLLPELDITDVSAKVLYSGGAKEASAENAEGKAVITAGKAIGKQTVIEVTATIVNNGPLPTHVARGSSLPGNRQDVAWLITENGKIEYLEGSAWTSLGVLDGKMAIPGSRRNNNSSKVKWIVAVTDNAPLKLIVSSQKGGTVVRDINY